MVGDRRHGGETGMDREGEKARGDAVVVVVVD
jgi:hypothetical protein